MSYQHPLKAYEPITDNENYQAFGLVIAPSVEEIPDDIFCISKKLVLECGNEAIDAFTYLNKFTFMRSE